VAHLARVVNHREDGQRSYEPAGSVMPPLPEADSGVGPPSLPDRRTVDSFAKLFAQP